MEFVKTATYINNYLSGGEVDERLAKELIYLLSELSELINENKKLINENISLKKEIQAKSKAKTSPQYPQDFTDFVEEATTSIKDIQETIDELHECKIEGDKVALGIIGNTLVAKINDHGVKKLLVTKVLKKYSYNPN